uniref:Uncharacterized protein n=1 Tax=Glossina pallidipes TaxID=7398 RepID=A0A1A9ZN15_GLOPL
MCTHAPTQTCLGKRKVLKAKQENTLSLEVFPPMYDVIAEGSHYIGFMLSNSCRHGWDATPCNAVIIQFHNSHMPPTSPQQKHKYLLGALENKLPTSQSDYISGIFGPNIKDGNGRDSKSIKRIYWQVSTTSREEKNIMESIKKCLFLTRIAEYNE